MTIIAAQTRYIISYHIISGNTCLNYFTRLAVFMDAVHVLQTVLYLNILLPQHAPHPDTVTYVARVNKFKYSHVSHVKMNIVKRDTYLPNTIIRF